MLSGVAKCEVAGSFVASAELNNLIENTTKAEDKPRRVRTWRRSEVKNLNQSLKFGVTKIGGVEPSLGLAGAELNHEQKYDEDYDEEQKKRRCWNILEGYQIVQTFVSS